MITPHEVETIRLILKQNNIPPVIIKGRPMFILRTLMGDYAFPAAGPATFEIHEPWMVGDADGA